MTALLLATMLLANQNTLPNEYQKNVTISSMDNGSELWYSVDALRTNREGTCYLDPNAKPVEKGKLTILVKRVYNDYGVDRYNVYLIPSLVKGHQWERTEDTKGLLWVNYVGILE